MINRVRPIERFVAQLRKLFIQKDDGTFEELAAIIADRDLRTIKKTTRGYVHSDKKLLIEILNKAK